MNTPPRLILAFAAGSLLAVSTASAQTPVNWDGDTSNLWATAGNWDTAPTNSLTANIANFNLGTYGGNPVFAPTVGTATSIAGITIGASNGTMTLTNTAALSIGSSGISIANGAGAFTISGSTTLGAAQSWTNNSANLFTFGAVTNGANLLTIGGSGNTTASGVIGNGAGGLTKEGGGILTLNAANTYTGATTVNGGELRWGVNNAIAGGALNVNDGGTVNIQTFTDTVGTVTIAKGGTITGTTGILTTGGGGLVANDGGTISGFSAGAGLYLPDYGAITYNSTGAGSTTLTIDRITMVDHAAYLNIANGAAAVDFEITSSVGYGGNNIGHYIYKRGAGVMQFSGTETGTGGQNGLFFAIDDGTALLNKADGVAFIPGNYGIIIGDGAGSAGSALLKHTDTGGNNQLSNPAITINSDGLFDLNGKTETTSGAVTLNSTGQLQLNNGQLTMGSLTLNPSAGNTTTLSLGSSGTLTLGGDVTLNAATTGRAQITGSALSLGGANRIFNIGLGTGADYDLLISAGISGARSLTKNGTGRLVLTGSNNYSLGTSVVAGTMQIGDGTTAGTMTSTGALTMGNAAFRVLAPASGGSSQTVASLATTASTGSILRLTPGASGNTALTITSATLSTGAGSSLNFDYTDGTTVGGTVGNNYVVWNPTLTGGIIGAAYTVTDSGGTGFATTSGGNVVRLTDSGSAGLPVSGGSSTGSYFVASGYSTVDTATPGSLVEALSGAVAASNVTVDTTGLASGANLALDTHLLTLGAGMVISGPNAYEITGSGAGGLRAAASGGTINLYNSNTGTVTISAPIVANGASRLTVDGPGTTLLSGANTYTGATVLNGGTTRFSGTMAASPITINNGVAQLGTTTGLTSINTVTFGAGSTGSLQLLGKSVTIGALSSNATLGAPVISNNNGGGAVANATLTIDSGSNTTFGGVIQDGTGGGTLALAKSGAGTLTLSGSNTYSGGTVINAGAVSVTADANLGDTSGGITLNGGRLTVAGTNITSARSVTVNGTGSSMLVNLNNNFTTSGDLTGSGAITFVKAGGSGSASKYVFTSASNTYTGAMSLEAVDVRVSSLGDIANNNIIFTGAGTFSLNDTGATSGLTFNNRAIELSNTSATVSNNNTTHAITIGSNLVASGAGAKVLTLSAAAGPTNIFSGNITDGTGGGTVGITKSGTGRWMLSGASNSYTGGTTVSDGTLIMTSPASLGNGALNVGSKTFIYSPTTAGALNIGSGVLTLSGTIGTAVGGTLSQSAITSSGTAVLSGTTGKVNIYGITGVAPTAGVNNLITAGAGLDGGTFTLGTVYNNTDFTVSAISRSATAISTTVTLATPLSGGVYWKGGLSGNTGVWSASTGLSGGQSNWQTAFSGGSNQPLTPGATADLNFSVSSSPGTMVGMTLGANMTVRSLTVNNTATAFSLKNDGYKLTITPDVSTKGIDLGTGLAASPAIAANIELGASQTWTNNSGRPLTVSGMVSGANNLTTAGADTITLSGNNTYTGATTVSAGTLLVNGAHTGGGLITVKASATLGGSGTMGDVTIENGGFLAPGASPGQMTVGNLTLNDTSVLRFELGAPTLVPDPGSSDHIAVGGNLTLAGTLQVTHSVTPQMSDQWLLMTYTGDLTGDIPTITPTVPNGLTYDILFEGKNVFLTVVPEPASAGLLLIGGLALRVLSRRRTLRK